MYEIVLEMPDEIGQYFEQHAKLCDMSTSDYVEDLLCTLYIAIWRYGHGEENL